jgi:hypothetical protein
MNYGRLFALVLLAIVVGVLLALVFALPVLVLVTGLETGLDTGLAAGAVLAGLLLAGALFAASPQAMPRALKPRTVESAITFFILINDSCLFSQRINTCFQVSADQTQPSCPELFLFPRQTII